MEKNKFGINYLQSQSVAVIAAVLGLLFNTQSRAQEVQIPDAKDKTLNLDGVPQNRSRPKLTLRLNLSNPDNGLLAMHRSHSSHSSHRSHSSHSSHSSHYSSSYGGSSYTPSYTPSTNYTPSATTYPASNGSSTMATYTLGERVLYKGCQGTDVKELQRLLVKLKYKIVISGYFGDKTEVAVKQFQKDYELMPDGRVGSQTLEFIKNAANGY